MRIFKKMIVIALCLLVVPVFWAGTDKAAYADEYTYSVTIYSGNQGSFGKNGDTVKKITGLKYGEKMTLDMSELDVKVNDSKKYYAKGLKLSGHDNDEISATTYQTYTFDVKEDMSFNVAYGIKGGMVKYTVDYQDQGGKKLRETDTYYGMAGDKPVVSYRYIEGYEPDYTNAAKTLTENEKDNHFVFKYVVAEGEGEGEVVEREVTDETGDDNGNAGAAAGNIITMDGNDTPTADNGNTGDVVDLDDDDTPKANSDDDNGGNVNGHGVMIGGIIALIVIALLIIYMLARRKREE